jgi:membrane-associated phospholipid phosphatase
MNRMPSSNKLRIARFLMIVVGLALWFWTQSLIGSKAPIAGAHGIGDAVLDWTAPWNSWLNANPNPANALLIASSIGIDALGLFLIAMTIFGRTVRPFLGLLLLFSLRQLCQALTSLPPIEGMIWRDTGVPTLLVTYGVSNDLFFSGHTALAVFGTLELARIGKRSLVIVAVLLGLFEVAAVLVLRAHYTMDVFAGAMTALFIGLVVTQVSVPVDKWLHRVTGKIS